MAFNKGYELKKFEAHWEKLRIEYAAAGMAGDAIQKMYDYDRQQFNSERTCIERTQEFTAPAYESSEEEASPLMLRYQEAITTTDTYHETKRSFAWIYRVGRDNPAKLPGWKKYVFPIYMIYNGKGHKDALPMKF